MALKSNRFDLALPLEPKAGFQGDRSDGSDDYQLGLAHNSAICPSIQYLGSSIKGGEEGEEGPEMAWGGDVSKLESLSYLE